MFLASPSAERKQLSRDSIPHDLFAAISDLKKELNAVILAHYYQDPDLQDIADYIGDSLGLSQAAADCQADAIVFLGVHFMAETAKILNPSKLVLLPDLDAGCSLADSCPPDRFAEFKAAHPDHLVISYIIVRLISRRSAILFVPVLMRWRSLIKFLKISRSSSRPIATWGVMSANKRDGSYCFGMALVWFMKYFPNVSSWN